jgi:hypothetical protein
MVIRDCQVVDALLDPFKECQPLPGTNPTTDEWPNNVLSSQAVVYSCGRLGRPGDATLHTHDPQELALCRRLAQEAAGLWKDRWLAFSDEGSHQFTPFFAGANVGDPVPAQVTEEHVRAAFGGTIRAECRFVIEPLAEAGDWWRLAGGEEGAPLLPLWRSTIAWFHQPGLHGVSFVQINEAPPGTRWSGGVGPSVLPRLVLALTAQGSLVGMYSCVVWT